MLATPGPPFDAARSSREASCLSTESKGGPGVAYVYCSLRPALRDDFQPVTQHAQRGDLHGGMKMGDLLAEERYVCLG